VWLCYPLYLIISPEKEGTYAMTNVIPMNKYLYTMNWAEADKALRKYVARGVEVPRPGYEEEDLTARYIGSLLVILIPGVISQGFRSQLTSRLLASLSVVRVCVCDSQHEISSRVRGGWTSLHQLQLRQVRLGL